jgi:hypothetical protein
MSLFPRYFLKLKFPRRSVALGKYRYGSCAELLEAYQAWVKLHPSLEDDHRYQLEATLDYLNSVNFNGWMDVYHPAAPAPTGRELACVGSIKRTIEFILPTQQYLKLLTSKQRMKFTAQVRLLLRPYLNETGVETCVVFISPHSESYEPTPIPHWLQRWIVPFLEEHRATIRLHTKAFKKRADPSIHQEPSVYLIPQGMFWPTATLRAMYQPELTIHTYTLTHDRLRALNETPWHPDVEGEERLRFFSFFLHEALEWFDPLTLQPKEMVQCLHAWLGVMHRYHQHHGKRWFCLNFGYWRKYNVLPFIPAPLSQIVLLRNLEELDRFELHENDQVITWGMRFIDEIRSYCHDKNLRMWQAEDGFIRSVGLGSDLIYAKSLCFDNSGIYFDARSESDLEGLLNSYEVPAHQLERAAYLITIIQEQRLTKYNLPEISSPELEVVRALRKHQRIIFVPMQVYNDASIIYGCMGGIQSYEKLLEEVRRCHPDACILVKLHPDVVVGNRQDSPHIAKIEALADIMVRHASSLQCIDVADEVHTLTSLTGFEALLQGKPVVTYGNPFYGGWGLTYDKASFTRRHRLRTLEELVAIALLCYAQYYSTSYRCPAPAETIVDELIEDKTKNPRAMPNLLKLRRNLFRRFKKKQQQF